MIDRSVMRGKLEALQTRYEELMRALTDPGIFAQPDRYQQVAKERANLEETVSAYREYLKVTREPEDQQLDVAIHALQEVLEREQPSTIMSVR